MRLSSHLLVTVLASGCAVLALAVGWLLFSEHRTTQQSLEKAASAMQRILELQHIGPAQGISLGPRFPDWYPVTRVSRPPGACVRLLTADGTLLRSECHGRIDPWPRAPRWFAEVYRAAFGPGQTLTRSIASGAQTTRLELVPDPDAEIAAAWQRATALVGPMVLVIGVLCLTVWLALRRAVRPAHVIMEGLQAIESGALDTRLGPFACTEFDRIARACNALAASLDASQRARSALTRRLLSVQEDERLALAHELHDEFGQHLSAIGANSAVLRGDGGAVAEAARRIDSSARHLLDVVRARLTLLRPWRHGEAGLRESLAALAAERVDGGGSRPRIALDLGGDLDALPADVAGAVYRIVQEALTNALRHASASAVAVRVAREADAVAIAISDDGSGCDPARLAAGFGVAGMRERAAAFGGRARVAAGACGGITVHARIPLEESAAA